MQSQASSFVPSFGLCQVVVMVLAYIYVIDDPEAHSSQCETNDPNTNYNARDEDDDPW